MILIARIWVFLSLAWVATAPAQETLVLKARLYDRDYMDFGGEFSDREIVGCPIEVRKWTSGMVRDTLGFDAAAGKKIPTRGDVDMCSGNLEKWFDPAHAKNVRCANLFLRKSGPPERPTWKMDDSAFFPMDEYSPQKTWHPDSAAVLVNDFAYCMEINAAFTYRGGETMTFRGDDDLWVFLDNRLVLDQGGIHFPIEGTTRLDSLPFLQGRAGETMDLDVYFCSRQPATSVFAMETDVELKPATLQSIHIVDTAGRPVGPRDVIVGPARLCAKPVFQVPGEETCGNYRIPPEHTMLEADWDLNGQTLSIIGGQACLDLDPASFPNDTRINLTAKAEGKTSRISITLIRLAKALEGTLSGEGRAERVQVRLDSAAGPAPEGLDLSFDFAGRRRHARVRPEEGTPWVLSGVLPPDQLGPSAVTGFPSVLADARQTIHTRVSDRQVALRDGVRPMLTGIWFRWGGMDGDPAYLDVEASEPLTGMPQILGSAVAVKRAGSKADRSAGAPLGAGLKGLELREARYVLSLPDSLAKTMRPGDSASLTAAASDSNGNPAVPRYLPIVFPGNLEETVGPLRLARNPVRGRAFLPLAIKAIIPVSAGGVPLRNQGRDMALAATGGPILMIPTLVPLQRIRLAFHDHLGNFVSDAERTFSPEDWDAVRAASPGDTTWLRLMWYPVSAAGGRLGTGAYIVQGSVWTLPGALVEVAGGEKTRVPGKRVDFRPRIFGYLRE